MLNVACTFINGPHRKKGAVTGLLPDATLTDSPRPRRPADPHSRPRAGHEPHAGRDRCTSAAATWSASSRSRANAGCGTCPVVEISDSYLGTAVYADIHYLSRLIGEELAVSGVQLADRPRPGPPRRAVPRAEADARPAGRHRPGRHDPEPRRDRARATSGSSSACWCCLPGSCSSAAS